METTPGYQTQKLQALASVLDLLPYLRKITEAWSGVLISSSSGLRPMPLM